MPPFVVQSFPTRHHYHLTLLDNFNIYRSNVYGGNNRSNNDGANVYGSYNGSNDDGADFYNGYNRSNVHIFYIYWTNLHLHVFDYFWMPNTPNWECHRYCWV